MACECFDPKVALVAIYKGFKDAHKFGDTPLEGGLKAIRHTVGDIGSRAREMQSPADAYFRTKLERRINPRTGKEELFWEGYDRSIRESMRRNVAWLKLYEADPGKIAQAKLEYHDWMQSEKTILDSNGDIPVRFFSLRDGDATLGMGFHQISWQNGELILESQLLPVGQVEQIEALRELVGSVREPVDFKQELPGMIRESLLVNQEVERPIHMIESMSGGAGVDVHLGSVHEEVTEEVVDSVVAEGVSVTEAPVYAPPVVVAAQPHPRGGVVVDKVVELVKPEAVIWVKPKDIVVERPVVPSAVAPILIANELQAWSVSDYRIEEEITEVTEVTESTHLRVSGFAQTAYAAVSRSEHFGGQAEIVMPAASEVTITELPKCEEITVSDVHLGSVHEPKEDVITEVTEITEGTETLVVSDSSVDFGVEEASGISIDESQDEQPDRRDNHGEHRIIQKAQRLFFNIELVTEYKRSLLLCNKSVKSVKAKLVWLGKNIANILADQLMGRNTNEPVFGWLVHGLAMMQFDEVEKKQKVKRFKLSPVRVWADRVIKVVKRVKSKFRQSVYGAYNHLFVTT